MQGSQEIQQIVHASGGLLNDLRKPGMALLAYDGGRSSYGKFTCIPLGSQGSFGFVTRLSGLSNQAAHWSSQVPKLRKYSLHDRSSCLLAYAQMGRLTAPKLKFDCVDSGQVLMSLPAPPPRPILRPLPQSELNSLDRPVESSGGESLPELWVPAATETAYLAPSKMGVHRLHLEGLAIEQIAEKKGVRVPTVESYLIEAIQGGLAYAWHRMGVSEAVRERVEEAVRAEMESVTAPEGGGSQGESRASEKGLGEKGLTEKGKEEDNGQASPHLTRQTPSGSGFRNGSTDGGSAKEEQASGDSNGLAVRSAAGFTRDGLAGLRLKVVMERIPPDESISFSQLRMVVAHLARLVDADTRQQKRMKLVASCHKRQSDG
jgi:hypothetical protein